MVTKASNLTFVLDVVNISAGTCIIVEFIFKSFSKIVK